MYLLYHLSHIIQVFVLIFTKIYTVMNTVRKNILLCHLTDIYCLYS